MIEAIPLPASTVDAVISNCATNLPRTRRRCSRDPTSIEAGRPRGSDGHRCRRRPTLEQRARQASYEAGSRARFRSRSSRMRLIEAGRPMSRSHRPTPSLGIYSAIVKGNEPVTAPAPQASADPQPLLGRRLALEQREQRHVVDDLQDARRDQRHAHSERHEQRAGDRRPGHQGDSAGKTGDARGRRTFRRIDHGHRVRLPRGHVHRRQRRAGEQAQGRQRKVGASATPIRKTLDGMWVKTIVLMRPIRATAMRRSGTTPWAGSRDEEENARLRRIDAELCGHEVGDEALHGQAPANESSP